MHEPNVLVLDIKSKIETLKNCARHSFKNINIRLIIKKEILESFLFLFPVLPESAEVGDVEYNERFYWRQPHEMSDCFKDALYRGTPFPIISLAEYFSLHEEGFSWGGKYREAGYYASVMLWYEMYNFRPLRIPIPCKRIED